MVEIIQSPHPTLRATAEPVTEAEFNSPALEQILDDMRAALATQNDGVALAAPQINISKRIFIVAADMRNTEHIPADTPLIYINPKITKKSFDRKRMDEGCLSVRPLYGKVRRASRVTIEAYDEHGEKFTVTGSKLLAQIFQHEYDHLDGILFIDKAKDVIELDMSNRTNEQ